MLTHILQTYFNFKTLVKQIKILKFIDHPPHNSIKTNTKVAKNIQCPVTVRMKNSK